jgi:hypothetical protein
MGGLALKRLKKEKGLKLTSPAPLIVLAKAIGLGQMAPCKRFCSSGVAKSLGLIVFIS